MTINHFEGDLSTFENPATLEDTERYERAAQEAVIAARLLLPELVEARFLVDVAGTHVPVAGKYITVGDDTQPADVRKSCVVARVVPEEDGREVVYVGQIEADPYPNDIGGQTRGWPDFSAFAIRSDRRKIRPMRTDIAILNAETGLWEIPDSTKYGRTIQGYVDKKIERSTAYSTSFPSESELVE